MGSVSIAKSTASIDPATGYLATKGSIGSNATWATLNM